MLHPLRGATRRGQRIGFSEPGGLQAAGSGLFRARPVQARSNFHAIGGEDDRGERVSTCCTPVDEKAARAVVEGATCHPVYEFVAPWRV